MKISNEQLNRYFYEYTIWSEVNAYNLSVMDDASRGSIITTTEARGLRDKLEKNLRANNQQLGQLVMNDFISEFNKVFGDRLGTYRIDSVDEIQDMQADYQNMIDMTHGQANNDHSYTLNGTYALLSISPYDPRFSHLGAILNHGSRLNGVAISDVANADKLNTIGVGKSTNLYSDLYYNSTEDHWQGRQTNEPLFSNEDITGLSNLRLLMTADEFDNVEEWANEGADLDNLDAQKLQDYREMTDKAVYILRGLAQEGYSYKIDRATRPGQLKATVDGTRLDVRIMDRPNNKRYIGRVYDSDDTGINVATYSSTSFANGRMQEINPTNEQALDMVNFMLGNTIYVRDGKGKQSDLPVGKDIEATYMLRGRDTKYHTASHTGHRFSAVVGPFMVNGKPDPFHNATKIAVSDGNFNGRTVARANDSTTFFKTAADAENYLRTSVADARNNFDAMINVEDLITQAREHADDPDYAPVLNNDPLVSDIQQGIWDALQVPEDGSEKNVLLKPGVSQEMLDELLSDPANADGVDSDELANYQYDMNMSADAMARQYVQDCNDYYIGSFDEDADGNRFNPLNLMKYEAGNYGVYRNRADIIKALRFTEIPASQLKGNDEELASFNNELIKFNPNTAQKLDDVVKDSQFMADVRDTIKESLTNNGVTFSDDDLVIDDHGIVQYTGTIENHERVLNTKGEVSEPTQITGQIGQIFEPDSEGIIYTKYAQGNYALISGYNAVVLPQVPGENKTMEERTRLHGYEQELLRNIKYQTRRSLFNFTGTTVGSPTMLNKTYHQLYADKRDFDFRNQYLEQGMSEEMLAAIIKSETQRVRYSNDLRAGSTINADYRANKYGVDKANDNNMDAYNLTGNRNMSVLTEESDGYYDPIITNATTTNQGIARFLASGAKVAADGHIIPGAKTGPESRMALMNIPEAQFMKYDPFDRQCMTVSNWLQASRVTDDNIYVTQRPMGGWNMDDGMVVSKKFADKYQIRDAEGKMRPLKVGDKISDFNGNKGVISIVVDPDLPDEKAMEENIMDLTTFFRNNPKLDVSMAPFPEPSRYNGGTARQLMRDPEEIVHNDGTISKAEMGKMPIIITDKSAEAKTKLYDDDAIRQGKGRKVSAQLAWSLDAMDAQNLLHEAFGRNGTATANLKEYLNTLGMNLSNFGAIQKEISTEELDSRNQIDVGEPITGRNGQLKTKEIASDFAQKLSKQGGVLNLPFEITLANGQKSDRVPVLSSYLRDNQEAQDGELIVHDYTHQYTHMYQESLSYKLNKQKLAELEELPSLDAKQEQQKSKLESNINFSKNRTQNAYNAITKDVETRIFTGKHNIFRDSIMAHRMPNSASTVWTEDPRLDLDQMAVGEGVARTLGVKDGDNFMPWRDPVLRPNGVGCFRVKIDKRLTGVAVNPAIDEKFDGDFDGDQTGDWKPRTKAANRELVEKFALKNNLLNYGKKDEQGNYPINLNHSLDIKVAEYEKPELADRWQNLTQDINDFERKYKNGEINKAQVDIARINAVKSLSDYYRDCYATSFDKEGISYENLPEHLRSVEKACLDTGAKGSLPKFQDYAMWLGAKMHLTGDGKVDYSSIQDNGDTLATRELHQDTMEATAIKSFGTGVAGAYSQRGMRALRNIAPRAVLELTYPVTDSTLQVKHEPKEAHVKYDTMMSPARNLWNGYQMQKDDDGWHVSYSDGKPVQATKSEWINTFKKMYTEDLNVDFNMDYVYEVADQLADDQGKMRSIETYPNMSTLDKLAYGGTMDTLMEAAENNENIFKGKYNAAFAPDKIRENVKIAKEQQQVAEAVKTGGAIQMGADVSKTIKNVAKGDTIDNQARQSRKSVRVVREKREVPSVADLIPDTSESTDEHDLSLNHDEGLGM